MKIQTDRFILREILPTDINGMYELDSNPEVHKYLGNQPIHDKAQLVEVINFIRQQYLDHGIGRWAIIDKKTQNFVGWAGLKFVTNYTNNHIHYYDLGYRLIERYWGKGIATEVAQACMQFGFEQLHLTEIYAMADVNNEGSNRILQKLGFRQLESFDLEGILHFWYKIEMSEFIAR